MWDECDWDLRLGSDGIRNTRNEFNLFFYFARSLTNETNFSAKLRKFFYLPVVRLFYWVRFEVVQAEIFIFIEIVCAPFSPSKLTLRCCCRRLRRIAGSCRFSVSASFVLHVFFLFRSEWHWRLSSCDTNNNKSRKDRKNSQTQCRAVAVALVNA